MRAVAYDAMGTIGVYMCLAIPGAITDIDGTTATIDMLGVTRQISVALTPGAQQGDWVLVHAGFAIEVIDAEEAERTIELVRELDDLATEDLSAHAVDSSDAQVVPSQTTLDASARATAGALV